MDAGRVANTPRRRAPGNRVRVGACRTREPRPVPPQPQGARPALPAAVNDRIRAVARA